MSDLTNDTIKNHKKATIMNPRKIIIIDTETTGLPASRFSKIEDTDDWPHIVQIAWIVCEKRGTNRTGTKLREIKRESHIIKPRNWEIPIESMAIHGISNFRANVDGIPLEHVFHALRNDMETCDAMCCHNVAFDLKVILAEEYRLTGSWESSIFNYIPKICTMEIGRGMFRIPLDNPHPKSRNKFKAPRLAEM